MSDQSQTSNPPTCGDIPSVISSAESQDGAVLLNSRDGLQLDLFGREVAPVRATPSQARAGASLMRETYGHIFTGSSGSADLTQSLASRLRERLATVGSTVYAETWKKKVTPLGRSYWAHTASTPRTSGKGSTGWPTPQTNEPGGPDRPSREATGRTTEYLGRTVEKQLAGWPTPKEQNSRGTTPKKDGLWDKARLVAGWATPRSGKVTEEDLEKWQARHERGKVATMPLALQAQMSGWSTPRTTDATGGAAQTRVENFAGPAQLREQVERVASGTTQSSSRAGTEKRGSLNPLFSLWLMGFPTEWGYCGARVTPSSRKSRRSS